MIKMIKSQKIMKVFFTAHKFLCKLNIVSESSQSTDFGRSQNSSKRSTPLNHKGNFQIRVRVISELGLG